MVIVIFWLFRLISLLFFLFLASYKCQMFLLLSFFTQRRRFGKALAASPCSARSKVVKLVARGLWSMRA